MRRCCTFTLLLLALVAAIVVRAGAQAMPKLPDGLAIAKSADSPGQVTFNHVTHVDAARPDCTTCHPKSFSILGSRGGTKVAMTHENFQQGRQCGTCHDGKKAFAVEDDCASCHTVATD
jgi:c(7)-type cytochrome triheme protein